MGWTYVRLTRDQLIRERATGEKEEIKARADKSGESVNAYINRLIEFDMKGE